LESSCFFFFIFGPLAIILGYLGYRNGDEKTGKIAENSDKPQLTFIHSSIDLSG